MIYHVQISLNSVHKHGFKRYAVNVAIIILICGGKC